VFPKAIDGQAAPRGAAQFRASTAVMFGAVLAARQATGGGGGGQQGGLMPKFGIPLYAVAAALVTAVTGEDIDYEDVRTRLKTGSNVTRWSVGWVGQTGSPEPEFSSQVSRSGSLTPVVSRPS
jgi:hypothetical protein